MPATRKKPSGGAAASAASRKAAPALKKGTAAIKKASQGGKAVKVASAGGALPTPWSSPEMAVVPPNAVYVEACKSWQAFKKRADAIGAYVAKHAKGAKVSVNLAKPRKGAFVVKTAKSTVVELLNMPRPFPKLKALDMDRVGADVVKAL
jgi:hypothetical protein